MKTSTLHELQTALDEVHWKMELADIHGDNRAWFRYAALYHELLAEYNLLCDQAVKAGVQ